MRLVAHGHGIGDSMVLSAVAHLAKEEGHEVEVYVNHPEMYEHSRDVIKAFGWPRDKAVEFWGIDSPGKTGGLHQVQYLAKRLGLRIPTLEEIRCRLWLSEEEKAQVPTIGAPYVTVSTFASWTENKNWPWDQWQKLVRCLNVQIFQLGADRERRLEGLRVSHLFMGAPFRTVAAVLSAAAFHLCPVTGTMHLASAVGTRSIVIYGGREDPRITGYQNNVNLAGKPPQGCAPCWLIEPCPHGIRHGLELEKPCMQEIRIRDVLDAIKRNYSWATVS